MYTKTPAWGRACPQSRNITPRNTRSTVPIALISRHHQHRHPRRNHNIETTPFHALPQRADGHTWWGCTRNRSSVVRNSWEISRIFSAAVSTSSRTPFTTTLLVADSTSMNTL